MKLKNVSILILVIGHFVLNQACKKENENEIKVSTYNGNESHKAGQNCMNCHKQGGPGEGWFNIGGTVYNELRTTVYPNATIKLLTASNNFSDLQYTIEVDANGNFFTTQEINFGTGLYVSVQGSTTTKNMISTVTSGQCNSCHGIITDKIWTK